MNDNNLVPEQKRILGLSPALSRSIENNFKQAGASLLFLIGDGKDFAFWYLKLTRIVMAPYDYAWRLATFAIESIARGQQTDPLNPITLQDLNLGQRHPAVAFFSDDISPVWKGLFKRVDPVAKAIMMRDYDRNRIVYSLRDMVPYPVLTQVQEVQMQAVVKYNNMDIGL